MNTGLLLTLGLFGLVALLSWPLGRYLAWALEPEVLGPRRQRFEAWLERLLGAANSAPVGWKTYGLALLRTNLWMFVVGFVLLWLQPWLPLNPNQRGPLNPDLIFNTASSFATNTNLQHYSGEVAMSHGSQLWGLMWLQFTSAATGLAALVAIARALKGRRLLGNFGRDLLRGLLLILIPLAGLLAPLLGAGGVPMTFQGLVTATTLQGQEQQIPVGPAAAFVAIKQLGTNGGGFYGPNSTHPFENPTFWTNLLSLGAILLLPMACVWLFGRVTGRPREARLLFAVMSLLLLAKLFLATAAESAAPPALADLPAIETLEGNWEGKELRLGPLGSSGTAWAVATTATSNGSVNCMHDSLQPLTGLTAMLGLWLGAGFGGIGVGLINLLVHVWAAVFLAGMLIGRTPEYMQKRLGPTEIRCLTWVLVLHGALILVGTALFCSTGLGYGSVNNPGPHGFSEILYEFSSAAANNGSGFEGLADNTPAWNLATGLVMLLGRFVPILWPLAIAGLLAAKPQSAQSSGSLDCTSPTFGMLLLGVILLVSALVFMPAAVLGPVADHLLAQGH